MTSLGHKIRYVLGQLHETTSWASDLKKVLLLTKTHKEMSASRLLLPGGLHNAEIPRFTRFHSACMQCYGLSKTMKSDFLATRHNCSVVRSLMAVIYFLSYKLT